MTNPNEIAIRNEGSVSIDGHGGVGRKPGSAKAGILLALAVGAAITEPFGQAMIDWYVRSFLGG